MTTDREYLKKQQAGILGTSGATDPIGEVNKAHTKSREIVKTGAENAATAVAETVGLIVKRKCKITAADLLPQASVTRDASNYLKVLVYKRDNAGANQVTLATWNTHNSAQGSLTANVAGAMSLITNTDIVIAAGSVITYEVTKTGTGAVLNANSIIQLDLEEV